MPYKDKELNKKYQKEWARRKARGESTKGINPKKIEDTPTPKGKQQRNKDARDKLAKHRQEKINLQFGNHCAICNKNSKRLHLHRKDESSHVAFSTMTNDDFQSVITSNDYIRLCVACHIRIHWIMKHMNMSWRVISAHLNINE